MDLTTSLFTIPEQISMSIKEAILKGNLRLGDKLPSENKLAELFGVSRSTIRDALRLLKTECILETRKGNQGGHFIAQKVSHALIQNLNDYAFSSLKSYNPSLEDYFELSFLSEVPIAGLAAINRSREDIIHLKEHLSTIKNICLAPNSSNALLHSVISYHRTLALATHNPLIIEFIDHLYKLGEVLGLQYSLSSNQKVPLFKSLYLLYLAIETQNASHARNYMFAHLHYLQDLTKANEQDLIFGNSI